MATGNALAIAGSFGPWPVQPSAVRSIPVGLCRTRTRAFCRRDCIRGSAWPFEKCALILLEIVRNVRVSLLSKRRSQDIRSRNARCGKRIALVHFTSVRQGSRTIGGWTRRRTGTMRQATIRRMNAFLAILVFVLAICCGLGLAFFAFAFPRWLAIVLAIVCSITFVVLLIVGYALDNPRAQMYSGFAGAALMFAIVSPLCW